MSSQFYSEWRAKNSTNTGLSIFSYRIVTIRVTIRKMALRAIVVDAALAGEGGHERFCVVRDFF